MICTNAFGMGIDKPDVRTVVHYDVPDDPESYFQEAGRAGRDGKKSFAALLYNNADLSELHQKLEHAFPSEKTLRTVYQALSNYFQLAVGSGKNQSIDFDLKDFCSSYRLNASEAHQAIRQLQQAGYIALSDINFTPSRLMITCNKEELFQFEVKRAAFEPLIQLLLRAYGGLFSDYSIIHETELARRLQVEISEIKRRLNEMKSQNLIDYLPQKDASQITFMQERTHAEDLRFDRHFLKRQKQSHEKRLLAMRNYVSETLLCRNRLLLEYFGEEKKERCGRCDNCLRLKRSRVSHEDFSLIRQNILRTMQKEPVSISTAVNTVNQFPEAKILFVIRELLDHGTVQYNAENKLILVKS